MDMTRKEKIDFLTKAILDIEEVNVEISYFEHWTDEEIDKEVVWYEYLMDK